MDQFSEILDGLADSSLRGREFREECMQRLDTLPTYDWSGVYRLEGQALFLDAYVGAQTDHTRILVGRGVCGTAVAENENQVIEDVSMLDNYLTCSLATKAEIVVLIKSGETILGQIDIDSHQAGAFNQDDEQFLEKMSAMMAERWMGSPKP